MDYIEIPALMLSKTMNNYDLGKKLLIDWLKFGHIQTYMVIRTHDNVFSSYLWEKNKNNRIYGIVVRFPSS